jgi:hypothetical protein
VSKIVSTLIDIKFDDINIQLVLWMEPSQSVYNKDVYSFNNVTQLCDLN